MTSNVQPPVAHERLAVLAWCGFDCDGEIEAWLRARVADHPNEGLEVHGIVSSTRTDRGRRLFVEFVRARLDFEIVSERGAVVARSVVAELCARVLRGELRPNDLARAVRALDAAFIGLPGAAAPYPDGLQHLWNALDWCDDTWNLENQSHLKDALEQFIAGAKPVPSTGCSSRSSS